MIEQRPVTSTPITLEARRRAVRETLLDVANEPFKWGEIDCCQFAAMVAHRITGKDYSAGYEYATENEANGILESFDESLETMVTSLLHVKPCEDLKRLTIGDPVLLTIPGVGELLGVMGDKAVFVKSETGVLKWPRLNSIKAGWNLG